MTVAWAVAPWLAMLAVTHIFVRRDRRRLEQRLARRPIANRYFSAQTVDGYGTTHVDALPAAWADTSLAGCEQAGTDGLLLGVRPGHSRSAS